MGAWGFGSFENDDAGDWAWELEESTDFDLVQSALRAIADREDYLEAPTCCEAIAAAETVAAALGRPLSGLPDEIVAWAEVHPDVPDEVVALARRALTAIETSSELRELWQETEHLADWRQTMHDLAARIAG